MSSPWSIDEHGQLSKPGEADKRDKSMSAHPATNNPRQPTVEMLGGDGPKDLDGRRKRSIRTAHSIIEANLSLVREIHAHPTVAELAKRARCSARSVFE